MLASVEASTFEQIQATNVGSGRVQMGVAETTDGSVVVPDPMRGDAYLWDGELGVRCSIGPSSDGEYRCLPQIYGTYQPNLFADAQCQIPLAALVANTTSSAEPRWLVFSPTPNPGCGAGTETFVYELESDPYSGSVFIPSEDIDGSPSCLALTGPPSPSPLYAPAGEVAPTRFMHFVREAE